MTFGHRLRAERERVGLNQKEFGAIGGVSKTTQLNYEADERHPDTKYLDAIAALGVDLVFLLTGRPDPYLHATEHQKLVAAYDAAPPPVRAAALAGLLAGAAPASIQVAGDLGQNVAGNVTIEGGFNMGGKKK